MKHNAVWFVVAGLLFVAGLSFLATDRSPNDEGDTVEVVGSVEDAASDFYKIQAANIEVAYTNAAENCDKFKDLVDFRDYVKPQVETATNSAFDATLKPHFNNLNGDLWDAGRAREMSRGIAAGIARHK